MMTAFTGANIGDYYRSKGEHSLVVYDNLNSYYQAYQSLYSGNMPYIVNSFSQISEKCGVFHKNFGGGSMTSWSLFHGDEDHPYFDMVQQLADNILMFDDVGSKRGLRPAIKWESNDKRFRSVLPLFASLLSQDLGKILAGMKNASFVQELTKFVDEEDELEPEHVEQLRKGQLMKALLSQSPPHTSILSLDEQCLVVYIGTQYMLEPSFEGVVPSTPEEAVEYRNQLLHYYRTEYVKNEYAVQKRRNEQRQRGEVVENGKVQLEVVPSQFLLFHKLIADFEKAQLYCGGDSSFYKNIDLTA